MDMHVLAQPEAHLRGDIILCEVVIERSEGEVFIERSEGEVCIERSEGEVCIERREGH